MGEKTQQIIGEISSIQNLSNESLNKLSQGVSNMTQFDLELINILKDQALGIEKNTIDINNNINGLTGRLDDLTTKIIEVELQQSQMKTDTSKMIIHLASRFRGFLQEFSVLYAENSELKKALRIIKEKIYK